MFTGSPRPDLFGSANFGEFGPESAELAAELDTTRAMLEATRVAAARAEAGRLAAQLACRRASAAPTSDAPPSARVHALHLGARQTLPGPLRWCDSTDGSLGISPVCTPPPCRPASMPTRIAAGATPAACYETMPTA